MTAQGILQIALYIGVLVALAKPLGAYMAKVYEGQRTWLSPVFGTMERGIYRLAGIDPKAESSWKRYVAAMLLVNFIGFIVVYLTAAAAGRAAVESARVRRSLARLLVQYGGEFCDQHQLARLRR